MQVIVGLGANVGRSEVYQSGLQGQPVQNEPAMPDVSAFAKGKNVFQQVVHYNQYIFLFCVVVVNIAS